LLSNEVLCDLTVAAENRQTGPAFFAAPASHDQFQHLHSVRQQALFLRHFRVQRITEGVRTIGSNFPPNWRYKGRKLRIAVFALTSWLCSNR
jgi:transposase